jgi:hypothetical protein
MLGRTDSFSVDVYRSKIWNGKSAASVKNSQLGNGLRFVAEAMGNKTAESFLRSGKVAWPKAEVAG